MLEGWCEEEEEEEVEILNSLGLPRLACLLCLLGCKVAQKKPPTARATSEDRFL
jgi:hypothetical protein